MYNCKDAGIHLNLGVTDYTEIRIMTLLLKGF